MTLKEFHEKYSEERRWDHITTCSTQLIVRQSDGSCTEVEEFPNAWDTVVLRLDGGNECVEIDLIDLMMGYDDE